MTRPHNRLWIALGVVMGVLLSLLWVHPAYAISSAYTSLSISGIDAYHNCLETDDVLIAVHYTMTYATNPTETIDQSMVGRFLSPTDAEMQNVTAYPYYNDGYTSGIFRFYWPAATAPDWDTLDTAGYTVQFAGNPTLSWSGAIPLVSVVSITKKGSATLQATSVLLGAHVLVWANQLSSIWSVLLTAQAGGNTVLSDYGEQYFGTSIPELRSVCPQIFSTGLSAPSYDEKTENATKATEYAGNLPAPLETRAAQAGGILGLDAQWFKFGIFAVLLGFLAVLVTVKTNNLLLGVACIVPAGVLSVNPGIISYILIGVTGFIAVIFLVWIFIWSRAP